MIPLRDSIPAQRTPVVNYAIIALCSLVFLIQLSEEARGRDTIVPRFGMIPAQITHPGKTVMLREQLLVQTFAGPRWAIREVPAPPPPLGAWATLITCMFLHSGWMHFLGNMWTLWIFGDNVEDRFGKWGYLALYLGTGIASGLTHLLSDPASQIPTIGASGAIAGVMGAYFLLYPRSMVATFIPFPLMVVWLPAQFFLGFWFLIQLFNGWGVALMRTSSVAWWAHIGGFLAGLWITRSLLKSGNLRDEPPPSSPGNPWNSRVFRGSPGQDPNNPRQPGVYRPRHWRIDP